MSPMAASLSRFRLLVLCAALAVSASTPARDDLPPLAPEVDIGTLAALVTLAARDRICLQAARSKYFAFDAYQDCMDAPQQPGSCAVTRSDLTQLRDLMASDSRLNAITSFESAVAYIASSCSTPLDAYDYSVPQAALPMQCTTIETPLLTAHAIIRNIPSPSTDERMKQRVSCRSTFGNLYLSDHCRHWARPRGRPLEVLRQQRPKYLDYFCPLKLQR
jgi:hypothetical protein